MRVRVSEEKRAREGDRAPSCPAKSSVVTCVTEEDLKKLRRPKFRVQAITPDMGCVKFVPDSKPLTDALHQSRGDLVAWLEEHKPAEMSRILVFLFSHLDRRQQQH